MLGNTKMNESLSVADLENCVQIHFGRQQSLLGPQRLTGNLNGVKEKQMSRDQFRCSGLFGEIERRGGRKKGWKAGRNAGKVRRQAGRQEGLGRVPVTV